MTQPFSSQHHSFDILLAKKYGVECAILIHHFQHWIRFNRRAKKNLRDGSCWTYQTRKEIQLHFPYLSYEEVKYLTEKLVRWGVLKTGNYNKSKMDKTLWYAFVDEEAFGVSEQYSNNLYEREFSPSIEKIPHSIEKIPSPIPDTKTYTKEKEEREEPPAPNPDHGIVIYKRVKIRKDLFDKLQQDLGEMKLLEMMERLDEYADLNPPVFKRYANHATVIRKWIREDKSSSGGSSSKGYAPRGSVASLDNAALAEKVSMIYANLPQGRDIDYCDGAVNFSAGGMPIESIKISEFGFRDRVLNRLRKMGLTVEGL